MDFALDPDQRLMQASISTALDKAAPLDRVRAFADGEEPLAHDVWSALAGIGAPGLLISEAFGGLGLGLMEAALAAECLGARASPEPWLGAAVLAPLAIALGGSQAQKQAWLPRIAGGEAIVGAAIHEALAPAREGAGVSFETGRLDGFSLFAVDALGCDALIVADRDGGLALVAADAFEATPLPTIDGTRRFAEVRFDRAPAERLAAAPATIERLRDAAFVMLAADMLGAAQTMLDKAVAYAMERRQFSRPIGSFQAVKHMCAEMAAELEPCRSLVWYAAHAFDVLPAEAPLAAAHAKAHLSEVGRFVARTATEAHGGIGFTDLLGLHLWFKRIGVDRQLFGGPEQVRLHAARLQGLAPA